jgi:hypothetical protein
VSCEFDGDNDVQTHQVLKARKEHKCDACNETIKPGHKYVLEKSLYDGSWGQVKRCARCEAIYKHLWAVEHAKKNRDYNEGPQWDLRCGHDYKSVHGVEPPDEIAALAFMTPEEAQAKL